MTTATTTKPEAPPAPTMTREELAELAEWFACLERVQPVLEQVDNSDFWDYRPDLMAKVVGKHREALQDRLLEFLRGVDDYTEGDQEIGRYGLMLDYIGGCLVPIRIGHGDDASYMLALVRPLPASATA